VWPSLGARALTTDYSAELLKQDGERYFITHVDDDSSWDEWVPRERIRFPKGK
jgi:hypothetical protein